MNASPPVAATATAACRLHLRRWPPRWAALLMVPLLVLIAPPLWAQAPLPAWQPPTSGPGLAAPVLVHQVRFEGLRSLPEAELQALAAPFLNRPLRGLEIEELRQRVTRSLIERGFVNSGALVADNAFDRGTLTLQISEGQVTRVQLAGMRGLSDTYLASRLVQGNEPLNVNVLQERFQLLLVDPLFTRLNARLLPDQELGQAVLDIDVTRARPWQLGLFANNHLAPAVGSKVAGVDGSLRNLIGWGDSLSGSLYKSDGSVSHDVSWAVPIGARRTLATLRLARTASSVIEEPVADLDIDSVVRTREFGVSHPVIDRAHQRLSIGLMHALRQNSTTLDGGPYNPVTGGVDGSTRIESWRLFQDLTLRQDRHVLALRASLIKGRNNLSAESEAGTPAPRRYHLWQAQFQAALALGDSDHQLLLRGQAQHSRHRLVPLEQMAVGGRYTVRGYRENTLVRDNAYSASAELHWSLWQDEGLRNSVKLVPFIDAGAAWNRGDSRRRLASAGLGLVWSVADFEGELYVAHRLNKRPIESNGDWQDHGIHIALRYRPF